MIVIRWIQVSDKVRSGEIDKSVCSCTRWEGLAVKGLIAESAYGGWEEPVSAGYEACCQVAEDAEGEAWPEGLLVKTYYFLF